MYIFLLDYLLIYWELYSICTDRFLAYKKRTDVKFHINVFFVNIILNIRSIISNLIAFYINLSLIFSYVNSLCRKIVYIYVSIAALCLVPPWGLAFPPLGIFFYLVFLGITSFINCSNSLYCRTRTSWYQG